MSKKVRWAVFYWVQGLCLITVALCTIWAAFLLGTTAANLDGIRIVNLPSEVGAIRWLLIVALACSAIGGIKLAPSGGRLLKVVLWPVWTALVSVANTGVLWSLAVESTKWFGQAAGAWFLGLLGVLLPLILIQDGAVRHRELREGLNVTESYGSFEDFMHSPPPQPSSATSEIRRVRIAARPRGGSPRS